MAMLGGSFGAPIIRIDAPANTFCGVHIGGLFLSLPLIPPSSTRESLLFI